MDDAAQSRTGQSTNAQSTTAQSTNGQAETYNAWSVVNLVFHHLVDKGFHPVLGETGDPGVPAAELLRALGVEPRFEGDVRVRQGVDQHLAVLREAVLGPPRD